MRKPHSYSSMQEALLRTQETYRRDLWANQNAYVEVWCEKEALSGVLFPITSEYDVPLMIVKGFPSKDFVHGAAETIEEIGKPAYLYYFGITIPAACGSGETCKTNSADTLPTRIDIPESRCDARADQTVPASDEANEARRQ